MREEKCDDRKQIILEEGQDSYGLEDSLCVVDGNVDIFFVSAERRAH